MSWAYQGPGILTTGRRAVLARCFPAASRQCDDSDESRERISAMTSAATTIIPATDLRSLSRAASTAASLRLPAGVSSSNQGAFRVAEDHLFAPTGLGFVKRTPGSFSTTTHAQAQCAHCRMRAQAEPGHTARPAAPTKRGGAKAPSFSATTPQWSSSSSPFCGSRSRSLLSAQPQPEVLPQFSHL